jgi:hypothetical protein
MEGKFDVYTMQPPYQEPTVNVLMTESTDVAGSNLPDGSRGGAVMPSTCRYSPW